MATETPKTTPAAAAPAAAAVVEKQTNCPNCNKPIKKLTRYYRDGIFYCAKKCWRVTVEKSKQEKADTDAQK
ncbi:MAG: hypothetical protein Q8O22_01470 [Candidatus Omnitrophota bacterium]|nr:hypothetical protein [Candidatus Omnitrophota bacterium]